MRLRSTGELLHVSGEKLTMISGSLNAVTLITGFMMFSMAHRAGGFDQRLVAAGCPRPALLLAKLASLLVAAAAIAGWATVVILWYWAPAQPWLFYLGLLTAALTYGGIGLVLGVFLPGELEGMFTIIMISIIDLVLQNPIINPAADKDLVVFLPTYGSMQTCVAAGFTDAFPLAQVLLFPIWLGACVMVGLAAFHSRTRVHVRHL
jgi:hypothetical protein